MKLRLIALILTLALGLLAAACVHATRPPGTPALLVPTDFRTIQQAIDAAEDETTIIILSGVYEEVLTISGKRLHFVGRDNPELLGLPPDRTRVPDTTGATGLINYFAGGGGSIRGLMLTGGNNGIVGFRPEAPPSALRVQGVRIQGTGRGILWCCAPLQLADSMLSKLAWHAISLPCKGLPLKALFVDGVAAVDSEGAGIYMSNCPGVASCKEDKSISMVKNVSLAFNKGGGVLAVNSKLCVKDSYIDFAQPGGMIFLGSEAVTQNTGIFFTKTTPSGDFGMGIINFEWNGVPAHVTAKGTDIYHPEGYGVGNFGSSHLVLESTLATCVAGGTDSPHLVSSSTQGLVDNGGNKCGCPFANSECIVSGGGLEPPDPGVGKDLLE